MTDASMVSKALRGCAGIQYYHQQAKDLEKKALRQAMKELPGKKGPTMTSACTYCPRHQYLDDPNHSKHTTHQTANSLRCGRVAKKLIKADAFKRLR